MSGHASASQAGAISSISRASRPRAWLLGAAALVALAAWLGASSTATAATCANAKYRTGPSLFLPDCRAYELVTPQGKTNILKVPNSLPLMAKFADDGETILYGTATGPLAEEASAGIPTWERAYRTEQGWKSKSATPPILAPFGDVGYSYPRFVVPSASLDKILFSVSAVFDPDQAFSGLTAANGSVHVSDGKSDLWVSKPTWSGALPKQGEAAANWLRFLPVGGSPDLSTVYFNSHGTLTPMDGETTRAADESAAVYKWKEGVLTNAGILPDQSISRGGSVSADRVRRLAAGAVSGTDTDANLTHPVSEDGKSLLFVSPDPARAATDLTLPKPQLYMAIDGQKSVLISKPAGADQSLIGTAGVAPVSNRMATNIPTSAFAVATADHSVVLFSTSDALTDDAPADAEIKTYRYETADETLTYMPALDRTLVMAGTEQNDKFGQVVELSKSGESMLYVTQDGVLRLWRAGLPTLTVSTDVSPRLSISKAYIVRAQFSDDETVLAMGSTGALRGNPDHTPGGPGTTAWRAQVYRYTVEDEGLLCISCKAGGSLTGASMSMWGPDHGFQTSATVPPGYWSVNGMTADGSTVYFTTATALTPEDHNAVSDVYQWRDGTLSLISTGSTGADAAQLYGTTPDGDNVFIISADRLTTADYDNAYDIYDVRVNGGIADRSVKPVCVADECQGPPAPAPLPPVTGNPSGHGNVKAVRLSGLKVTVGRNVDGRVAVARFRAPDKGRLVLSGRFVKKTVRRVDAAGQQTIRIRLSESGVRRLSRYGVVKVTPRVVFRPASAPSMRRVLSITFNEPGPEPSRTESK